MQQSNSQSSAISTADKPLQLNTWKMAMCRQCESFTFRLTFVFPVEITPVVNIREQLLSCSRQTQLRCLGPLESFHHTLRQKPCSSQSLCATLAPRKHGHGPDTTALPQSGPKALPTMLSSKITVYPFTVIYIRTVESDDSTGYQVHWPNLE